MKEMKKLGLLLIATILLSACGVQQNRYSETKIKPEREEYEWLDVWLPHTNETGLPRVLLIGNSITRAYYPEVEKLLQGKAFVGRLCTSKSLGDPALLEEITLILKSDTFDIIHFNNGLHGWAYTEEEYKKSFPVWVETIRKVAPSAKLIWATSSPIRQGEGMLELENRTQRIIERNRIAAEYIAGQNIVTDDLFTLVIDHPEYYAGGDGTHLVPIGVTEMAKQVARIIEENSPILETISKDTR
jgi:lysophospholipase L1-like esterase